MACYLRHIEGGVEILVHVRPRASRSRIAGEHDGRLKIAVAAPPVDGAANGEVIAFLAERLGVAPRAVTLVSGERGRRKVVRVQGVTVPEAERALGADGAGR